jgi:pantetheine-phosphate adenylyltransferase
LYETAPVWSDGAFFLPAGGSMKRAVYPGTFDPVTYGHLDVIRRARTIFDEVIVAVANNAAKQPLFSMEERVALLRTATQGIVGVRIDQFDGLVVEYTKRVNATVMIRGLRMLSDFEYEFQMALTNRKLWEAVETIFLMPSEAYSYVSARLIKETAALGADVSPFVPPHVVEALRAKVEQR